MRRPASPNRVPVSISSMTAIASPASFTRTTPLPAASPSALMTSGQPSRSVLSASKATSADSATMKRAVGTWWRAMNCFAQTLLVSMRAAPRARPENRPAGLDESVDHADRERQLGTDDGQRDAFPVGQRQHRVGVGERDGGDGPTAAIPALPGAQTTRSTPASATAGRQGVFTGAGTEDEDVHGKMLINSRFNLS